jgi:hypothetical protein
MSYLLKWWILIQLKADYFLNIWNFQLEMWLVLQLRNYIFRNEHQSQCNKKTNSVALSSRANYTD